MSAKSFITLLTVTLVAAVGAIWITATRDIGGTARGEGILAFPDLEEQANNVRRVEVTRGNFTSTLESEETDGRIRWSLKERDGYPVPIEIVRAVAGGMARLRLVEPKTSRQELYPRIHVDDPRNKEDAKGSLVELFDREGRKLASLIVGLDRADILSIGDLYVRRPDESRAWLAHGKVPVPDKQVGWLNQVIVEVDLPRVRESILRVPGEPPLRVYKENPGDRDFILEGMPEGYELKELFGAEDISRSIQTLSFEEVKPMSEVGLAYEGEPRLRHITFDGLIVEEWAKEVDGKLWVAIKARPDPEPKDPSRVDAEKIKADVAKINGTTEGWAYTLNEFETKNLRKTMAGMTQPKEGAAREDGGDADGEKGGK